MIRNVTRVLAHLAVFLPLFWGNVLGAVTAVLLLAVCYIKTMKLGEMQARLAEQLGADHPACVKEKRLREKWRWITYVQP